MTFAFEGSGAKRRASRESVYPELAFRKSIAEVANKLEIASIETQGGDSSEMIVLFARSRMSRIAASFFCRAITSARRVQSDYCAGCAVQAARDLPASLLLRRRRSHVVRGEDRQDYRSRSILH